MSPLGGILDVKPLSLGRVQGPLYRDDEGLLSSPGPHYHHPRWAYGYHSGHTIGVQHITAKANDGMKHGRFGPVLVCSLMGVVPASVNLTNAIEGAQP